MLDTTQTARGAPRRPEHTDRLERIPWTLWRSAGIVVLGAFASMLSATITNPAQPAIAADLHASPAATAWVTIGYLLALAGAVPLSSWAGRRLGVTRLWLLSLALFSVFSIGCALSGSLGMLVAGRVLQGLAGGLLVPAGQTITSLLAGRERLGRVLSTIGIAVVIAPTLGTTLGSVVVTHLAWTWLFWIQIPPSLIALAAGARLLPRVRTESAGRLDWLGLLLVLTGLPLLTYGISAIAEAEGLRSTADLYAVSGVLLLAGFVLHSLRSRTPVVQLRLFANGVFGAGATAMFFGGAVNFGAQVILPLYFTDVRHESLLAAGLLIGPQVIGTAIGFPLAGRLTDRIGAGPLLVAGGLLSAAATIPLALVGPHTGYPWLGAVLFVRGFGVALSTIPAMTAGIAAVAKRHVPDATPLLNMLQRTGASIGTALAAVLFATHAATDPEQSSVQAQAADLAAFRYVNWWLFAAACLLALPAYFLARTTETE